MICYGNRCSPLRSEWAVCVWRALTFVFRIDGACDTARTVIQHLYFLRRSVVGFGIGRITSVRSMCATAREAHQTCQSNCENVANNTRALHIALCVVTFTRR